jgi:histidinol-phosphate aminotransferase
MITDLVRENIKRLLPYTCARDLYSKGILLDANENSLGSSVGEFESLTLDLNLNRYPDPHQNDLKELIGSHLSIKKENLFFGVGSDELIDLLIRIFCEPRLDTVIIAEPTYGMYKVACDINNVATKEVRLNDNFDVNINNIEAAFDPTVKMIFLCSPNNPTGNLISKKSIVELAQKFNCAIVVDEAYIDFAEQGYSIISEIENYPNIIVIRTFSKAWGLAAIRLGYCIADPEVISYLFKIKAPYNINILTRSAVEKAIENVNRKNEFVSILISERERLSKAFKNIKGITDVYPSDANFILIRCKNAKAVQKELAERGVVVRDRSGQIMLQDCLRISVGTEPENNKLIEQLTIVLNKN